MMEQLPVPRNNSQDQEKVRRAALLPGEILALVSHEIRTPLMAITGYATTLQRHLAQLTPEEYQEFLSAIMAAGKRLEHTINLLMDLSQLEIQTTLVSPMPINLKYLVQEAVAALSQQDTLTDAVYRSSRVTLYPSSLKDPYDTERFTVRGDYALLRSLLDHLLDNALRFSAPSGTAEISIERLEGYQLHTSLSTLPSSGMHLAVQSLVLSDTSHLIEIQLRDNGPGIQPEQLPLIFERFYQAEDPLTREHEGLGLGLSICKRIVELHQGLLYVESTPGYGTIFHIILQAADDEE